MPRATTLCLAVLALTMAAPAVLADCPYDHLLVGQDAGKLFLDLSQLYRHWNTDWATNPNPQGQEYYEFSEMYGGGFIRVEPGFSENDDPMYALTGTRGEDYNIVLERFYARAGLELRDDSMSLILENDGDTYVLSDYPNHHVHMRYVLGAGADPGLPYAVSYRLRDSTGTYADSDVYTVNLGAVAMRGDADRDGDVDISDLSTLAANWQKSEDATWGEGDFDGDRDVDISDLSSLAANWGVGTAAAQGAVVPEPSTLSLFLGLAVTASRAIRRGRRRLRAPVC